MFKDCGEPELDLSESKRLCYGLCSTMTQHKDSKPYLIKDVSLQNKCK